MPRRTAIGVVTSDKGTQTRRVEIPRLVRDAKYGKTLRRRTICHVHDAEQVSGPGDTVEIIECPPKSKQKKWELVRVVTKSVAVDIAAMRSAARARRVEAEAKQETK